MLESAIREGDTLSKDRVTIEESLKYRDPKEVLDSLPKSIIDFHVHVGPPLHDEKGKPCKAYNPRTGWLPDQYLHYPFSDLRFDYELLFGDKKVSSVLYPFPFWNDANVIKRQNEHVIGLGRTYPKAVRGVFIVPDLENPKNTRKFLDNHRDDKIIGLKPYWLQLIIPHKRENIPASAVFTDEVLKIAQDYNLAVFCHVAPKQENYDHLVKMARKYDNAKIIVAHAAKLAQLDSREYLKHYKLLWHITQEDNMYLDLADYSTEFGTELVLSMILAVVGHPDYRHKIIGGTDLPFGLNVMKYDYKGHSFKTAQVHNTLMDLHFDLIGGHVPVLYKKKLTWKMIERWQDTAQYMDEASLKRTTGYGTHEERLKHYMKLIWHDNAERLLRTLG